MAAILFGLAFVGYGLYRFWRSLWLLRNGIFTIGTVTKIKITHFIRFKTAKKKTIVFNAGGWTSTNIFIVYQVGNSVPLFYDPKNPNDAMIYSFDFMWLLPLASTGVGLFILYQGLTHL